MLIGISGKINSGKDTFADLLCIALYQEEHNIPPVSSDLEDYKVTANMVRKARYIKIVKFADALKDIVCRLTGCTREQLEDQDFKNSNLPPMWHFGLNRDPYTYRRFLQELGTDILRNWIPNIHVNATFSTWKPVPVPVKDAKISGWGGKKGELEVQKEQWPKWIITDMRFPNELVGVQERGGITIRIERRIDLRDPQALVANMIGTGSVGMAPQPLGSKMYEAAMRIAKPHESETALDDYQNWDVVIDNNGTIEELYQQAVNIVKQFKLT